jgi:hypothetical protein
MSIIAAIVCVGCFSRVTLLSRGNAYYYLDLPSSLVGLTFCAGGIKFVWKKRGNITSYEVCVEYTSSYDVASQKMCNMLHKKLDCFRIEVVKLGVNVFNTHEFSPVLIEVIVAPNIKS